MSAEHTQRLAPFSRGQCIVLGCLAAAPLLERVIPSLQLSSPLRTVIVFAIMALGLNIVVGWTGLLNLGIAAFAAIRFKLVSGGASCSRESWAHSRVGC